MAAGFRRKLYDQEIDEDGPNDGNQNDAEAPRTGRRKGIGVVKERELAQERHIVDKADNGAKEDGPETGAYAEYQRDEREDQKPDGRRFS